MELSGFTSLAESDQSVMIMDYYQKYLISSSSAEAILIVQNLISRLAVLSLLIQSLCSVNITTSH